MRLDDLIRSAGVLGGEFFDNRTVKGIAIDSRKVEPGFVFIAIKGHQVDGHTYVDKAIDAGAIAIVAEQRQGSYPDGLQPIIVEDSAKAAGLLANVFLGNPSSQLKLIGITGTNGKTTTATLMYQLFMSMGFKTGLISTVENKIGQLTLTSTHTTPDPIGLNELLADMVHAGCEYVFMEVSSHAVHQKRIAGLEFAGGVFTNISRDHLDYHNTFEEYIWVKKAFFDQLPPHAFALTNTDDKRGMVMVQNTQANITTYSLKKNADFRGKILENTLEGLLLTINGMEVHLRLIGEFNAYNALCAFGIGNQLGLEPVEILVHLSGLKGAAGRFDTIRDAVRNILYIVDYAHTPDALENVLKTIIGTKNKQANVITVIGCGGNRDKGKRPMMAEIATKYSQTAIFTSDNPRDEDPLVILQEMEKGVPANFKDRFIVIEDRYQAIKVAGKMASAGDIVLVAGKGHETYQEVKGVKNEFDDRKVIKDIIGY